MIKNNKIIIGILFIIGLFAVVYGAGFHVADEILSGSFKGNYIFDGYINFSNANISGIVSSNWEKNGSNLYYMNGNVGIGTENPTHGFHLNTNTIDGVAIMRLTSKNNGDTHIRYDYPTNNSSYWVLGVDGSAGIANDFLLWNSVRNNVDLIVKNDTGNVGIGTTNPQVKLDVNGNVLAKSFQINCDDYVKLTISNYVYENGTNSDLNSILDLNFNIDGQNVCSSGWHICNAQEVMIYGTLFGCSVTNDAWIIGGFPNMEYHRRSLWNGQSATQCLIGEYPTWYRDFYSYNGRVHCRPESSSLPVACCRAN